ncbi:hypothetical protein BPIT_12130 [Candidatus Brocadia pituitae]|nr:hypothetical protein BPIT_12130 [Candidatus Brocadia pituitae]
MSYLTISLAPFYAQGLEKVCKAYILGKSASEYEGLPEKEAREKIDKIVRDKRIGTLHLTHPA